METAAATVGAAKRTRRRFLVASHEASRTGAPRVAIHLLRALDEAGFDTTVVHLWGGPLEAELNGVAEQHLDEPFRRLRAMLRRHPRSKLLAARLEKWSARRVIRTTRPDLVWCNTVVSLRYAEAAADLALPCIVYSHEQPDWLDSAAPRLHVLSNSPHPPLLVGCSESARLAVSRASGSALDETDVLHSPVDATGIRERQNGQVSPNSHNAPALVTACGTTDTRKGFDVFVEAARLADERGIPGLWRWIGGPTTDLEAPPNLEITGSVADAVPLIAASLIFACPSRSDSFPLVVLEAMALARPIIGSRIDGIEEQLGDTGVLVAPADPIALVDVVETLIDDAEQRSTLGAAARARCDERWDVNVFSTHVARIANTVADAAADQKR